MTTRAMENTSDALGQSVILTRQARVDLAAQISELNGRLAALGAQWQGQGATAFVRVHQAWHEQVGRLLGALDGFAVALEHTERSFDATDADVTAAFHQFSSRLG
ncbi:WXG100 family type VII secretion target [Nocardioides sp.]|uniref:WXG100 family type VII secretion target n=1 Tax=Nocardioides sp. TaxID=35761 RepID=UPI003D0AE16E